MQQRTRFPRGSQKRAKIREGLHPAYLSYYDALCNKLPPTWQPISGLRTLEEQRKLFEQGRTVPGKIVTNAPPGRSMHNYGLATDWAYFYDDNYCPLEYDDKMWMEYQNACLSVGLRVLNFERPHNELLLPFSVRRLYEMYLADGMEKVQQFLNERIS